MPSRRTLLTGSAAMLATSRGRPASGADGLVRFGGIADPQYADAEPDLALNRYFANSLDKLRAAIGVFNGEALDFVVSLGDLIDRDRASVDPVLAVYATLRHRHVILLGNHDFSVEASVLGAVPGLVGLTRTYDDFAVRGTRFVLLDGSDVSLFAPPPGDPRWPLAADRLGRLRAMGACNANPWNGSLGAAQMTWLEQALERAQARGERVVVMNHYPVFPDNPHNLWDSGAVTALLARHPHVIAYLCGHNHAGDHGELDGLHFVTFRGMVDTARENAFAIVEIAGDRLKVRGFGREPSRSLRIKTV